SSSCCPVANSASDFSGSSFDSLLPTVIQVIKNTQNRAPNSIKKTIRFFCFCFFRCRFARELELVSDNLFPSSKHSQNSEIKWMKRRNEYLSFLLTFYWTSIIL